MNPSPPIDYGLAPKGHRWRTLLQRAGLLLVFLLVAGAVVVLPWMNHLSHAAARQRCLQNLRAIGDTIHLYANENAGQLPPSLGVLGKTEDMTTEFAICPATGAWPAASMDAIDQPGGSSYVYVRPGSHLTTLPSNAILMYEPLANHGDSMNVLLANRTVVTLDAKQGRAITAMLQSQPLVTWPPTP